MEHLISEQWFIDLAEKNIFFIFLTLLISFVLLFKGADWFVEGAASIAYKLKVPPIIIGATIVSIGTTSAEAAVSVMAAFNGQPGLALGNGIGSVICDTGLIFGICCCVTKLPVDKFTLRRQGWVQFLSGTLFAVFCYVLWLINFTYISRAAGIVLISLLVWYIAKTTKWAKEHKDEVKITDLQDLDEVDIKASVKFLISIFMLGLVFVLIGSRVLIGSVTQICIHYGVPESVIAATVVAFGTSLPELSTAIASIVKGHKELLLGNIIGADILNILFVIGAAAVASPLAIPKIFFYLHLPALLVILLLFRIYGFTDRKYFRRWYGVPLLGVYAIYIAVQFLIFS